MRQRNGRPTKDRTEKITEGGETTSKKESSPINYSDAYCVCGKRLKKKDVWQIEQHGKIVLNIWHECECGEQYMEEKTLIKESSAFRYGEGKTL